MKNKILIKVYIPVIDEEYNMFIPTNESLKTIIDLIVKSVNEISGDLLINNNYCLLDPETSNIYDLNVLIRDTNIRNDKKLMLI